MADTTTKPGYKTTEFWLTFLADALGLVMMSGALDSVPGDSLVMKIIGGAIFGLSTLGYTAARGKAKAALPPK